MLKVLCNGRTFLGARTLHITFAFLFLVCNPFLGYFYFLYIDQLQKRWWKIPVRMGLLGSIPLLLNVLLMVISLWNGMIFSVDATNVYARGPLFFLVPNCNFLYLLGGQAHNIRHILKHKKGLTNILNILFPIPLIIAAIVQAHNEHIQVLFLMVAFTLLMTFLHLQNIQASRDYLTSLYNRSVGELTLTNMLQHRGKGKLIGGLLMDIDGFKEVNDQYGHDFGDRCLRDFSQLLTESFSRSWLICRYGGDEFLLFREMYSPVVMEDAIIKFKKNLDHFNAMDNFPFVLSASIGKGIDEGSSAYSASAFIKVLDVRMYLNKRSHYESLAGSDQTKIFSTLTYKE